MDIFLKHKIKLKKKKSIQAFPLMHGSLMVSPPQQLAVLFFLNKVERKKKKKKATQTICSQRSLFTDPRSSTISLKGAVLVGSATFFSGRFTSWKSGKGLALNLGTWKNQEIKTGIINSQLMLKSVAEYI